MSIYQFITVILLTLGLGLFLAGLFTAYFGRGKSRMVGVTLTLVGILIEALPWAMYRMELSGFGSDGAVFVDTLIAAIQYVGAFLIGAVIALAIFLVAIMKT
ncbi:MAG: hypothetical protein ACOC85_00225 [Thermoplasmatota archaeon]